MSTHRKTAKAPNGESRQGASYWLDKQLHKKAWREEGQEALEDALTTPGLYELRNMASGHGMPIQLAGRHGVFWSKGWRGCEFGCGHKLTDWDTPMYVSVERREGIVVWRRGCKQKFNPEEE